MALQPLRWDNVNNPQFNNSSAAIAADLITKATDSAGRQAEAFHQLDLEQQAKVRANALNEAVARMRADGKATPEDLIGLSKDVDQGLFSQAYDALRTTNADLKTSADQSTAFQTENARNQQLIAGQPLKDQQEAAYRAAQQSLMRTQENTSKIRGEQITGSIAEQTRIGEERVQLLAKTRAYEQGVTTGFREQADTEFEEFIRQDGPPNPLLDTPEQREQFITKKLDVVKNSADEHRKVALENNLTLSEWETTPEAKRVLAIERAAIDKASERGIAAYESDVAYQKAVDDYAAGNAPGNLKYVDGEVTWGTAGPKITTLQKKDLLDRYGLEENDDEAFFTKLGANMLDPSMYAHELETLVVPKKGLLGGHKGYKLVEGAKGLLQTHIDDFKIRANNIKNKRTTAYAGVTAEESAINKAAADSTFNQNPNSPEEIIDSPEVTAQQRTDAVTARIEAIRSKGIPEIPKDVLTYDVKRQLQSIQEALSGKETVQGKPTTGSPGVNIYGAGGMYGGNYPDRERTLSLSEISTRIGDYEDFLPTLIERIKNSKTSEAEKDNLQLYFDNLLKKSKNK